MNYTYIALVALSVAALGVSRAEGPDTSAVKDAAVQTQKDIAKRNFFKVTVTLEAAGKEEASYVAYCSEDSNSKKLFCTGSLVFGDTGYWRLNVDADMRDHEDDADVEISIDDLKAIAKNTEGVIVPLNIFSTSIQAKGPGRYLIGQVQGMAIKVEISKVEQATDGKTPEAPQPPR